MRSPCVVLELSYGINGDVLRCLKNYLTHRTQSVSRSSLTSCTRPVLSGVPVLRPLLFVLEVADVGYFIDSLGLAWHAYADDIQLFSFYSPHDTGNLRLKITDCLSKIKRQMADNRLMLNPDKIEFL